MKFATLNKKFVLWMSERNWLKSFVRGKGYSHTAGRFIAGKTMEDAIDTVKNLTSNRFEVTMDLLGEFITSEFEAKSACIQIASLLNELKKQELNAYVSLKLTQLGLGLSVELCEKNMRKLMQIAQKNHQFIRIDMEDSSLTDQTLTIFHKLQSEFGSEHIGIVIQSCLYRTPQDITKLITTKSNVRVVKGAYLEPEHLAFPKKKDVDLAYVDQVKRLLKAGNYTAIATHDENMIIDLMNFIHEQGISKNQFEFQMLYGIATDLQHQLKENGFRVRIYTPFGDDWYPYFTRRLAERPANLWFVLKHWL